MARFELVSKDEKLVLNVKRQDEVKEVLFDELELIDERENVLEIISNEINRWFTSRVIPTRENIKMFLITNKYCKELNEDNK